MVILFTEINSKVQHVLAITMAEIGRVPGISHSRCTFSGKYEILVGTIGNLFPFDVVQR